MATVTIFRQSCKGIESCGICAFVCPRTLFHASKEMNEAGYLPPEITDETECTHCKNCMVYCPDFAIVVEKGMDDSSNEGKSEDE